MVSMTVILHNNSRLLARRVVIDDDEIGIQLLGQNNLSGELAPSPFDHHKVLQTLALLSGSFGL
jgi:hypothetical protein